MKKTIKLSLFLTSMVFFSACASNQNSLFSEIATQTPIKTSNNINSSQIPNLGNSVFSPISVATGKETGTFVGQKARAFHKEISSLQDSIERHNDDLQKIRSHITLNANQYSSEVASIESRLQLGTTPSNPYVVASIQNAQGSVQKLNEQAVLLNQLSTRVSSDVVTTNYILNSIKSAYLVSGAVDEDHTQLKSLQGNAEQTNIVLSNILNETNNDYNLSGQYIANSNQTINNLADPVSKGNFSAGFVNNQSLATKTTPVVVGSLSEPTPSRATTGPGFSNKPLFVAKFNKSNIDYEEGLSKAVSSALKINPDMSFEIVAVASSGGNLSDRVKSREYATKVFEGVIKAGANPANVGLSAKSDNSITSPEVHIYIK